MLTMLNRSAAEAMIVRVRYICVCKVVRLLCDKQTSGQDDMTDQRKVRYTPVR